MTPRDDLQGACPRDCLHGGHEWIDDLSSGQEFRIHRGEDPVPVSPDLSTYDDAPMGSHEIIMYFDACRDSIHTAGKWLIDDPNRIHAVDIAEVAERIYVGFCAGMVDDAFRRRTAAARNHSLRTGSHSADIARGRPRDRLRLSHLRHDGNRDVWPKFLWVRRSFARSRRRVCFFDVPNPRRVGSSAG